MRTKAYEAVLAAAAVASVFAGCGGGETETPETTVATLTVTSPAFGDGQKIPAKYTADGEDISPPLKWEGVPDTAKSLAVVCEDPDAPSGTWDHWVIYSLPPDLNGLPEEVVPQEVLEESGAKQGLNDFRRIGYNGPDPPAGEAHRYVFTVYATDLEITLDPRATKKELLEAMGDHIVAKGTLTGTYGR